MFASFCWRTDKYRRSKEGRKEILGIAEEEDIGILLCSIHIHRYIHIYSSTLHTVAWIYYNGAVRCGNSALTIVNAKYNLFCLVLLMWILVSRLMYGYIINCIRAALVCINVVLRVNIDTAILRIVLIILSMYICISTYRLVKHSLPSGTFKVYVYTYVHIHMHWYMYVCIR